MILGSILNGVEGSFGSGTPWRSPGTPHRTPGGPDPDFLQILGGLWDPLGTHFKVILVAFSGFERLLDDIFPNLVHPDP